MSPTAKAAQASTLEALEPEARELALRMMGEP